MKKASLLVALSASAMILAGGVQTFAAEGETSPGSGVYKDEVKKDNKMNFEITAGDTDTTKDPDPIDGGGEPTDVKPGPLIPHKGNLAITAVPHLNFGKIKLGGKAAEAHQGIFEEGGTKYKPAVRVDDIRGTNAGWTLFASLGTITSADGKELKGATLDYPSIDIATNNVHAAEGQDALGDLHGKPSLAAKLNSDKEPHKLMEAQVGEGRGGNQAVYYFGTKVGEEIKRDNTKEIKLTVPAGSLVGVYSADVVYQLTEKPAEKPAE